VPLSLPAATVRSQRGRTDAHNQNVSGTAILHLYPRSEHSMVASASGVFGGGLARSLSQRAASRAGKGGAVIRRRTQCTLAPDSRSASVEAPSRSIRGYEYGHAEGRAIEVMHRTDDLIDSMRACMVDNHGNVMGCCIKVMKDETKGYLKRTLDNLRSRAPDIARAVKLGGLFLTWYACNIAFNLYNKQVFNVFPYPLTCTAVHLGVSAAVGAALMAFNVIQRPKLSSKLLLLVAPLAALHAAGFALTNLSLSSVAVSFTHTIKALEPFFTVLLSVVILGYRPTPRIVLSLAPVVIGVILATVSELSFTWFGFLCALGSNLAFQSRNVISKSLLSNGEKIFSGSSLFQYITALSLVVVVPLSLMTEGVVLTPANVEAAGGGTVLRNLLLAALARCGDVLVSYAILSEVSPVTHSVGNCVKRVSVIACAVLFFRTPLTSTCMLGTAMALGGVLLYTLVLDSEKKRSSHHRVGCSSHPCLYPCWSCACTLRSALRHCLVCTEGRQPGCAAWNRARWSGSFGAASACGAKAPRCTPTRAVAREDVS